MGSKGPLAEPDLTQPEPQAKPAGQPAGPTGRNRVAKIHALDVHAAKQESRPRAVTPAANSPA